MYIIYENRRRYRALSNIYNQKLTVAIIKIVSEMCSACEPLPPLSLLLSRSLSHSQAELPFHARQPHGGYGSKNKILWLTFHNLNAAALFSVVKCKTF